MPELPLDQLDLYYELHGSGPRVLLFNGSGQSIESSRPLIEVLATRCTVAVHDQRGLGRSSAAAPPYSMADYASDGAALLDHLGWEDAAVFGISFGGMVAMEFAVTWPTRLTRLALACTSPGGPTHSSYPLEQLATLPEDERVTEGLRVLDRRFAQPGWFDDHPDDLALVARLAEGQRAGATPGAAAQLAARAGHDVCDRLDRIACPTLVMAGAYDGIAPIENARYIVEHVDGAELREYEGGHAFLAQDPAALPAVLDFLAPER